ncbi:hypothetical protein LINPERHAP1_LOCUS31119, partial [Linum perenne]
RKSNFCPLLTSIQKNPEIVKPKRKRVQKFKYLQYINQNHKAKERKNHQAKVLTHPLILPLGFTEIKVRVSDFIIRELLACVIDSM